MKIGLTGAMGSGKSAACAIFSKLSVKVVSADNFCNGLLTDDNDVKSQVKNLLGNPAFYADSAPNKPYISAKVFGDANLLAKYERIFHLRFEEFLNKQSAQLCVYEVPLLFEKSLEKNFDLCLSVFCSERLRRLRLYGRNVSDSEIFRRDKFQLSCEKKATLADIVLFNESSHKFLEEQIVKVLKFIS